MKSADKALIGVLPLIDDEKDSYWMLPGYMDGILDAGGVPVMLPVTEEEEVLRRFAAELDAFLFTGGHDVSPTLYKETVLAACGPVSAQRDAMEAKLFRLAYAADKPMLGICRGIQFINVMMGGTLWQDLPTQRPTEIEHHQKPPYFMPSHRVTLAENSPLHGLLADLTESGELLVNSYHHQAVKDLAPGLKSMAVSEDGLTEAVWDETRIFLWAVQWHPEFAFRVDEASRRIFRAFTEAAMLRKN